METVPAAPVARGSIEQIISYSGEVRAKEQVTVLPKATGRVQRVLVDVGSPVRSGDLLAELSGGGDPRRGGAAVVVS